MGTISVNHKMIDQAVVEMIARAKDVKNVLDELDRDISNDVMRWGGRAKESYVPAKAKWDQSMAEMITHLSNTATTLDQANVDFGTTDSKNAAMFDGIPTT
ncbi:MAG: WXG100 family type VII secretion target [Nocardioides sp.]